MQNKIYTRTKCKYVNPNQIYEFSIASLALTYSSLVANQRTKWREKQTERGFRSTEEAVVSSTRNERHDGRSHHTVTSNLASILSFWFTLQAQSSSGWRGMKETGVPGILALSVWHTMRTRRSSKVRRHA